MTLLLCLAAAPGTVVARTDLLDATWPQGYGSDEALTKAISGLRRALGDSAREARIIETVPKRGYRLIAAVRPLHADAPVPEPVLPAPPATFPAAARAHRLAPLWSAIVMLAVALIGQWFYLTRATPVPTQKQIRYYVPLDSTATPLLLASDTLRLGPNESTRVVVHRRAPLPTP